MISELGRRRGALGPADARPRRRPGADLAPRAAGGDPPAGPAAPAASASARAREHPQQRRRRRLAARRARADGRCRTRARAGAPSRRRADRQRRRRLRRRTCGDRRPVRHRHALPLEGARLPARCAARRLGRADGARPGRQAPLRRRDAAGRDRRRRRCSTRSITTSPDSPTTTRAHAGSPKAGSQAACPSSSTPSRRTSSSSMSARWGSAPARRIALLAERGVRLSGTVRPGCCAAVTHLDIDDADIDAAIELGKAALDGYQAS